MYATTPNLDPIIRLVPHSGIQFVNYAMKIDEVGRLSRRFIERPLEGPSSSEGKTNYQLITAWDENDPNSGLEESARATDKEYAISERAALEMFMEKWIPIPMFRVKVDPEGKTQYDVGPTNWARMRIVEVPDRLAEDPVSHHVVIAFDTELRERRPQRPYTAPDPEDAQAEHEFSFVYRFQDLAWFLGATSDAEDEQHLAAFQKWIPTWLKDMLHELKEAQRPNRKLRDTDFPYAFEHIARYLVFLEYMSRAIDPRVVRLIDTVSASPVIKPIAADLILDIGNSRTCGIVIETRPNDTRADLNNSYVLALRDLSAPERTYSDPFESHVELSQARFGRDHLSVHSGTSRAFFWPSPVRVGPEAGRFRQEAQGNEAITGLSSPKRYLCDVNSVQQEWRFPDVDYDPAATGRKTNPLIDKAMRQFVNQRGDVIAQLEKDRTTYGFKVKRDDLIGAQNLSFSRSSFFTLMVAEIIWQAIVMVNDVGVRENRGPKDAPRKLRRIILTLPPAMPVQEQRLLRSRAEGAVKLIWQLMGWWGSGSPGVFPPEVHVAWDEASCVQLVYLYGEIIQKLGGSIRGFMDVVGRPRAFVEPEQLPAENAKPEASLRVASIDVGGGTTDLMITTYYEEDNVLLKPVQNFREGFRIAGDDILRQVIERLVIPAIEQEPGNRNFRTRASLLLNELFGGDRANMAEQEKTPCVSPVRAQGVRAHRFLRMLHDAAERTPAWRVRGAHAVLRSLDFFP